jgi:DNA-binding CsgD family transcriptional regulator
MQMTYVTVDLDDLWFALAHIADKPYTDQVHRLVGAALEAQTNPLPEVPELSPKQKLVLQQLADGFSPREIGEQNHMAFDTVRGHIKIMRDKYSVHSIAALLAIGFRYRWIK